ncbi:hypothetical protein SLE2022_394420 [Rubroshorea leprosula]
MENLGPRFHQDGSPRTRLDPTSIRPFHSRVYSNSRAISETESLPFWVLFFLSTPSENRAIAAVPVSVINSVEKKDSDLGDDGNSGSILPLFTPSLRWPFTMSRFGQRSDLKKFFTSKVFLLFSLPNL